MRRLSFKYSVLIVLLFFLSDSNGYAQVFPDGVYFSLEQLKAASPAYNVRLAVTPKAKKYRVTAETDSVRKLLNKKRVLAYAVNDSLYIRANEKELNSGLSFSLALSKGNYIVFYSPSSNAAGYIISTAAFGAIAGPALYAAAQTNQPFFVLSLRTGNINHFNALYVENRLKEIRPDLLPQFYSEPSITLAVLLRYVQTLNEIIRLK